MHQLTEPSGDSEYAADSRGQSVLSGASDADLMCLLRRPARDLRAFEMFYDRHHGHALALAARFSDNSTQIEQAVEDAFLLVWRRADRYQPVHAAPHVWLFGIVAWRCRALASAGPHLPPERVPAGAREPIDGRRWLRRRFTHELGSKTLSCK